MLTKEASYARCFRLAYDMRRRGRDKVLRCAQDDKIINLWLTNE